MNSGEKICQHCLDVLNNSLASLCVCNITSLACARCVQRALSNYDCEICSYYLKSLGFNVVEFQTYHDRLKTK